MRPESSKVKFGLPSRRQCEGECGKTKIRILVATTTRSCARGASAGSAGTDKVVGSCRRREALQKALELSPDVVLLDISMPRKDGLAVTGALESGATDKCSSSFTAIRNTSFASPGRRSWLRLQEASPDNDARYRIGYNGEAFSARRLPKPRSAVSNTAAKRTPLPNLRVGKRSARVDRPGPEQ